MPLGSLPSGGHPPGGGVHPQHRAESCSPTARKWKTFDDSEFETLATMSERNAAGGSRPISRPGRRPRGRYLNRTLWIRSTNRSRPMLLCETSASHNKLPLANCPKNIGRVEDWRAGIGRSLCSLWSRPFVCECHTISTIPRFQPPPRRTQRADFLALRSPVCFTSRLMGPILSERLSTSVAEPGSR